MFLFNWISILPAVPIVKCSNKKALIGCWIMFGSNDTSATSVRPNRICNRAVLQLRHDAVIYDAAPRHGYEVWGEWSVGLGSSTVDVAFTVTTLKQLSGPHQSYIAWLLCRDTAVAQGIKGTALASGPALSNRLICPRGQVTYRVVAVAEPQPETRDNTAVSVVSTATFAGAPQVCPVSRALV